MSKVPCVFFSEKFSAIPPWTVVATPGCWWVAGLPDIRMAAVDCEACLEGDFWLAAVGLLEE